MTKRTKWSLGAAGLVAAVAAGMVLTGGDGLPVEVDVVRRDSLSVTVDEQGRTRARDRYVVAAPVSGRLSRPEVREGQRVARGDVLATLAPPPEDPRTYQAIRAQVSSAEARLEQARFTVVDAEGALEQARSEVARRLPLLEQGALSRETVERYRRAEEAAARADLAATRARLVGADVDADAAGRVAVRAPVEGRILRVVEESERVVPVGSPLFEIADPDGLEVVVDLLTEDAVLVAPDDPMVLTGWGGQGALHGRVRYVEPSGFTKVSALGVEEQRVNVVGDLDTIPPSLGEGFRVQASIVVWRGQDVLTVATSALFRQDGGWRAFAVEGGRAVLRPVEIGHRGQERSEVLGGLAEGDVVIPFPSDEVTGGARVRVPDGG